MNSDDRTTSGRDVIGRRRFLSATGVTLAGTVGFAGCLGGAAEQVGNPDDASETEGEPISPDGTSWDDLAPLEGNLELYSGRTPDQIEPILLEIEALYDDFEIGFREGDSAGMVGQIAEEGDNSSADLFYTQDSGTLGALKAEGRTAALTDDVLETVPEAYRDPDGTWTGVSGRTRCVAYNTDRWDAEDLPDDIFAYAEDDRFDGEMGWRTDSGSFYSFVRAMMLEYGEETTREWIEGLQELGITNNEGGSTTPRAIADGELSIGFVNHYYVGRLIEDEPDAPVDITFTDGDIGSLFNVSGVAVVDTASDVDLARNFVRHLLTLEGQRFFVETNAEYPVIPAVDYVGDLPNVDELAAPSFDLNELADVDPATALLRDVGIL